MDRYLAFDVETPNWNNDRMSAIGAAVIEDGRIVDEFFSLVNPEQHFDRFNIRLTGITPEMAADAPTFLQLWPKLRELMDGRVLLAHNAPFDMAVLSKCLRAYGISWREQALYACTCRMGRRCFPQLPNHKLDTMCGALGIALDHHQAMSDCRACAALFLRYCEEGLDVRSYYKSYDLRAARTASCSCEG